MKCPTFWLNPILNILIVTRGIIHVYTITARMLCRCNASAAKNFQGSASGAILILWCAGIIMQRKGIVIFMDNQLLQIQNRTCRIYGTASAEYLLLQMVDEHDLAGMEREVEAIHRQTTQPFLLAAVQAENWNDDLSPWPAPPVWGEAGLWRQGRGYACMAGAGCAEHPSAVFYKGRLQSCFGRLLAGRAVCIVGSNAERCAVWRSRRFAVRVVSRLAGA